MNDPRAHLRQLGESMRCDQCVESMLDYVDGLLSTEQGTVFEAHLAICPACTTLLANYRKAVDLAGRPGPAEGERDAARPRAIVEAILAARKPKR